MIVDTSALVAILKGEPDAADFAAALDMAAAPRISAANFLELSIVVDAGRKSGVSRRMDDLLRDASIAIEPVTEAQARVAREAYRDYGKGSGHPAQLNFGDCFAYALARDLREPLLYKGSDFAQTDVRSPLEK